MPDEDASVAPGAPGTAPTWSSSAKDAVGTSCLTSRVWFTIGHGIVNEIYWPRVDRPQIRDLGFIVADDADFWSEVKRDAETDVRETRPGIPAIEVTHRHARYTLSLRICTDDHADVVLIEATLEDPRPADDADRVAHPLRLYPLIAPHLGFSGLRNRAWTGAYKARTVLFAQNGPASLALVSDPPPARQSVGYVGVSDGWQDFDRNGRMTWTFATTDDGNVAGMTELLPSDGRVELALGFGTRPEEAALEAIAAVAGHFDVAWDAYVGNWQKSIGDLRDPGEESASDIGPDERALYLTSASVLHTHQDRTVPGAMVASLSIPWGNTRNDLGGYHLVWSRDLVESAGALVALGAKESARRTLAYLVATQESDGRWPQNQWIDGVPYWPGVQLDEAAFPILLVGALRGHGGAHMLGMSAHETAAFGHLVTEVALDRMIAAAASFITRTGPVTAQDRWEENEGLTPSTLAPVVAGLVLASRYLPEPAAGYCLELADDWNASIEDWTYATGTSLAARFGVDGHYIRIAPSSVLEGAPLSTPVPVRNRSGDASSVPADDMVGTDFLSLVRYGLRAADDPRILSTLAVVDGTLRTETPNGPVWHRYSGDGYGEHEDGSAFDGTGVGRGWPLLVGERGHYELDAGRDARPYLTTMCRMAAGGGMLPEQVWDAAPIPERGLLPGRPAGSAMPLAWAHAEYVSLVRSIVLGHCIHGSEAVWTRYHRRAPVAHRATWRFAARRPTMVAGRLLRLEVLARGRARCSFDGWQTGIDVEARDTGLGVWVVDVPGSESVAAGGAIDFTFWWIDSSTWDAGTYRVDVVAAGG